jgi:CDP-diacylglycerol--serine O-phosphatidyltransferase
MNLRKTFFILPNLFTISSIFCGFFALTLTAQAFGSELASATSARHLYLAALAICFGVIFDTFDGRVARLTKTQSQLGMQLDSLADVITFGAAPALLIYRWGLLSFGLPGVFVAFLFVAAGAARLARFNVLASRESKPGKFIIGLPIPVAAGVLVLLVVVNFHVGGTHAAGRLSLIVLVVVLSFLMISRIRFRSFKDVRPSRRTLTVVAAVIAAGVALSVELRASFVFLLLVSAYVALGLSEEVLFYRRRRAEERAAIGDGQPQQAALLLEEEASVSDEEVLAELGAFDEPANGGPPSHPTDPSTKGQGGG